MQAQFRSLGIAYVSVKMKTTNIFGEWLLGMKQTFAVIGLGRFGGSLLESLIAADQEVLAICLLYTSDAADEEDSVDLGGRR